MMRLNRSFIFFLFSLSALRIMWASQEVVEQIEIGEQKVTIGMFFDPVSSRLQYGNHNTFNFYKGSCQNNDPCIPILQYLQKYDASNYQDKQQKSLVRLTELQRMQSDSFNTILSNSRVFPHVLIEQLPKHIPIQYLIKNSQFKKQNAVLYTRTFEHENVKYIATFVLATDISRFNDPAPLYHKFKQRADYALEDEQELEQNKIIDLKSNNLHGSAGFYKPDYSYSWRQKWIFGSMLAFAMFVLYSQRNKFYISQ